MKKQKHVQFENLPGLLNELEKNWQNYRGIMINLDFINIGDLCIRRYYNIDPENTSEQYSITCGNCKNEYILLPNKKIWYRENVNDKFKQMDFKAEDAEHMWYQTANLLQGFVNKHLLAKFLNDPAKRETIRLIIVSFLVAFATTCSHTIADKYKQKNTEKNSTEIPVKTDTLGQPTPLKTVTYNAAQHQQ